MIHLISLYNSYPPRYIHNRFVKFFKSPLYTSTSILPLIDSHSHFAFVRSYLLDRTTTAQHQIASTIAKAIDSQDYDTEDDLLVRAQFRRKLKSMHNLVIPYIHEARFASYRITQTTSKQTHESSKRKRDTESTQNSLHSSMKSMSQLSISQEVVCKKVKNSLVGTASSNDEMKDQVNPQEITLYKPSKYLKMPRKLLLHSLHLQLNCSLKKTAVQRFICTRVRVIDQQFCFEQIR